MDVLPLVMMGAAAVGGVAVLVASLGAVVVGAKRLRRGSPGGGATLAAGACGAVTAADVALSFLVDLFLPQQVWTRFPVLLGDVLPVVMCVALLLFHGLLVVALAGAYRRVDRHLAGGPAGTLAGAGEDGRHA